MKPEMASLDVLLENEESGMELDEMRLRAAGVDEEKI